MVRGALLVVAVGGLGLVLGAAIAGRPQAVPNDVLVTRVPEVATTTTTSTTTTTPTTSTTTSPERPRSSTTTARATTTSVGRPAATPLATARATTTSSSLAAATTTPAGPPAPSGTPAPLATLVPEAGLRLIVANATDTAGLAARTLAELRTLGYSDASPTDAVTARRDTIIVHVDGRSAEALRLAGQIGVDPTQVQPRRSGRLTVAPEDDADLWLLPGADRS
jgi:hypothetical protein